MSSHSQPFPSDWTSLSLDLTELILSYLPICSIIRASTVCKQWRHIITTPSFSSRVSASKKPWFFLYGQNNIFLKNNQAFAFDPESNEWIRLPTSLFSVPTHEESFIGSGGFFFTTTSSTSSRFSYATVLNGTWRETSPLKFSRRNPLVGVYRDGLGFVRFIVVGGVRLIGGLVDIEEDRLAVEIYNPRADSWELCSPLPPDFRSGNSSQWLTSALYKGKCYVFGIYSSFISWFDLRNHVWSRVQILHPPGIMYSFLLACKDQLVLAGLCNTPSGVCFKLWKINELTMEYSEIGIMPHELLSELFDSDEEDKFATLKCVGLGNLIYIFNEEHHKMYPACVCEIGNLKCSWRKVPKLPTPVNRFHKVISFCSTVSLGSIFQIE